MDWTQITELITTLLVGGGLVTFVTVRDKKTEAILDNMQKVIDGQREMMDHQKGVYDDILSKKDSEIEQMRGEMKEKESKYESNLARKDEKIERDYKLQSSLRHHLDDANTRSAVNEILRCVRVGCDDRNPPLTEHIDVYCKKCGAADTAIQETPEKPEEQEQ